MGKLGNSGSAPGRAPEAARSSMVRFVVLFPVWLLAGFGLLFAPFARPAVDRGTALLVEVSALLVRVLGGQATAQSDMLRNPASGFSIRVMDTCNASNVTVLLWAAILAFPAPWPAKGKGLAAGTAAIHVVNLLRIVSLFYLGQVSKEWFEIAHLYMWESLIVLFTLVIFWLWVQHTYRSALRDT
ncbi:MAG TPA: exosortase H [Candidatus Acidoferrales bacterium]|nr:exosortase H [Candidatus Acidoferrales bacterium]